MGKKTTSKLYDRFLLKKYSIVDPKTLQTALRRINYAFVNLLIRMGSYISIVYLGLPIKTPLAHRQQGLWKAKLSCNTDFFTNNSTSNAT